MSTEHSSSSSTSENAKDSRDWSTKAFLMFLGVTSLLYATVLIYHIAKPPDQVVDKEGILEQCRQICMQYGLVSTGHVRKDAEAYLNVVQSHKLTEGLAVILADSSFKPVESQSLELLNKPAPEFALPDVNGLEQKLSELGKGRPVVVVFYLGYGCSHCVAQLLSLDKDLHYFSELDADIVAISSTDLNPASRAAPSQISRIRRPTPRRLKSGCVYMARMRAASLAMSSRAALRWLVEWSPP